MSDGDDSEYFHLINFLRRAVRGVVGDLLDILRHGAT